MLLKFQWFSLVMTVTQMAASEIVAVTHHLCSCAIIKPLKLKKKKIVNQAPKPSVAFKFQMQFSFVRRLNENMSHVNLSAIHLGRAHISHITWPWNSPLEITLPQMALPQPSSSPSEMTFTPYTGDDFIPDSYTTAPHTLTAHKLGMGSAVVVQSLKNGICITFLP